MSSAPDTIEFESPQIREEFTEFDADGDRIAVITDPENPTAWIRSSLTAEVDP